MNSFVQRLFKRQEIKSDASPPRLAAELRGIEQSESQDVFLAGYPKSGNTWCQAIVSSMLYGLDINRTPETIVQSLVPDVHYCQHYVRFASPTVFKTHFLPQPRYKKVIYLLRDGRDVMTSYYHYLRATEGAQDNTWESIVLDGSHLFPSRWFEHVQAWEGNPYNAEMHILRYEDLKTKTIPTMRSLAGFLGVTISDMGLERIADMTTFTNMKVREKRFGWVQPFPKDKTFVRRGAVGGFADEMPPDILDYFEKQSAETLEKYGYQLTPPLNAAMS